MLLTTHAKVSRACEMNPHFHSYVLALAFSEVYSLRLDKQHEDTTKLCQEYLLNQEYPQEYLLYFKMCKQIM